MKNIEVYKKFAYYLAVTLASMVVFYAITFAAERLLGHEGYGLIAVLAVLMVAFLWVMARESVENDKRKARWAEEDAKLLQSRLMEQKLRSEG